MADDNQKVSVRIYFKSENGIHFENTYSFEKSELERLKKDFLNSIKEPSATGGAYTCEVLRPNRTGYDSTLLMLKFD